VGSTRVDFTPLYIFVSRRGSEQRKETPKKQRQCRHLPRLGFPLWNPSSEAPPLQGMAKGGNPSPLRRERQIYSRLRGPWGSGASPPWLALWGTAFAVLYFPLTAGKSGRGGPRCPAMAGLLGQMPCGGFGFQGPKKTGPESQRLCDLSPARPCHKAASVSEHYGRFVAPSAPVGLP